MILLKKYNLHKYDDNDNVKNKVTYIFNIIQHIKNI
jgi:hypothetical protein